MLRQAKLTLVFVVSMTIISIFFFQMQSTRSLKTIIMKDETVEVFRTQRPSPQHHRSTVSSARKNFSSDIIAKQTAPRTRLQSLEKNLHALSIELQHIKEPMLALSAEAVKDLQEILDLSLYGKEKIPLVLPLPELLPDAPLSMPVVVPKDKVVNVFLLSYQRTGSTFIGGLFNSKHSRDTFYIYEPLDLVYAAMYGTDFGWTVPADIRVLPNGSARTLPERELAAIDMMLESVFSCTMSKLPVPMLLHPFWMYFRAEMNDQPFINCLRLKHIELTRTLSVCRVYIKKLCGGRFNAKNPNLDLCQRALYNNGTWTSTLDKLNQLTTSQNAEMFMRYHECVAVLENKARYCAVQHFDNVCKTKSVRVVKTVRATMLTAHRLLQKMTNLKVVHSFRDPRGAVHSRKSHKWTQGHYDGGVLSKLAKTYCDIVLADFRLMKQLEAAFNGRVRYTIYDGFVRRPMEVAEEIIDFAGMMNSTLLKRGHFFAVKPQRTKTLNSTVRAEKWHSLLKPKDVADINKQCLSFFTEIDFKWSN